MADGFDAALEVLVSLGCRLVEIPFGDFYATANLLYEGAWVAERYAAIADFMEAHEGSLHPVTRQIIGGARKLSAADAFKGLYALQAFKAKLAPVIASVDLFCVPTAPTHYTRRSRARRSDRHQQPARHLHQLRQPARHVRHRGAGRQEKRRPADERHPAGAGRRGSSRRRRSPATSTRKAAPRSARPAGRCRRRHRSRRPRTTRRSRLRWSAPTCPACRSTAS